MLRFAFFCLLVACSSKSPGHEDRKETQTAPSKLTLAVDVGGAKSSWADAEFAAVPKLVGKASDGEARDTWSLRALVEKHVGPGARVTAVINAEGKKTIDAAAWADAAKIPILHTTKRGSLKFRWSDAAGAWGDTIAKDVTAIEVTK